MVFVYIGIGLFLLYWACWISSLKQFDDLFIQLSVWLISASFIVPAYGGYRWLRTGEWEGVSLRQGLLFFFEEGSEIFGQTGWVGVDMLAQKYLSTSLGWTVLAIGVATFWSASFWIEEGERRRKRAQSEVDPT